MRITTSKSLSDGVVPVVALRADKKIAGHPLLKTLASEDRVLLDRFIKQADLQGPSVHSVFLPSGRGMYVLALGEREKFTFRKSILAMRQIIATAKKDGTKNIAITVADFLSKGGSDIIAVAETMATQFELANFDFVSYKAIPEKGGWKFMESVEVLSDGKNKKLAAALAKGKIIGEEINNSRTLANTPGGDMTPALLAKAAMAVGKANDITVKVLDEKELAKLGMGGILGVGQGSDAPPRLIVMEYFKGPKKEAPVVLVGKGITFDSGGLNLKPTAHINDMHLDMSGGAAMIHTMATLARLKARKNVVALIPAAENMPSGASYRPGDLLRTMSGKTIEVLNTDAEGRVVMSDALTYAKKYNPRLVVDAATLTGAAVVALGERASALFATDRKLENLFRETGERVADFVWPLPLWEEYEEDIKGTFGDVANSSKSRYGGAIDGAVFLWQFIKGYPWVHLDIAPRMTSIEGEFLAKGSAGAPVNLLVHVLEKY